MSAKAREAAAVLRRRYAKHFGLSIEEVELEEFKDDWVVFAKNRSDLPQWTLGYND